MVHVLVGAPAGLTAAGSQLWSQDSPGVADQAEGSDQLGSALATGDFNGDGPAELAMGTPGENLNRGFGSGVVHVLPGSGAGLTAAGSQLWSQDSPGVAGAPEFLDFFGQTLAASIPSGADGTPVMGRQLAPSHADRHPSNDSDPAPAPLTHAVCGLPALATRRPAITGHPSLAVLRRTHPAGSEDVLLARRRAVNPPIASSLQLLYACSRSAACWGQANKAA